MGKSSGAQTGVSGAESQCPLGEGGKNHLDPSPIFYRPTHPVSTESMQVWIVYFTQDFQSILA